MFSKIYIAPLFKKLNEENSFLQRLLETIKQSGLGLAVDDGDSRKVEMDAKEDQVILQLDLVSSLPAGLVELLAADSPKENVSPPVSPDTWMAGKNLSFLRETVEKVLKLRSIKETNTDQNYSLKINYKGVENKASILLKENGKTEQEYMDVFKIENVQINNFSIVGNVFSTNIRTNSQKVEVLVKSMATGKEQTKTFDTSSGKMDIPLEELGLEMGLSYKLKASLATRKQFIDKLSPVNKSIAMSPSKILRIQSVCLLQSQSLTALQAVVTFSFKVSNKHSQ